MARIPVGSQAVFAGAGRLILSGRFRGSIHPGNFIVINELYHMKQHTGGSYVL